MIECPTCGTRQSEWAARCGVCGGDLARPIEADNDDEKVEGQRRGLRSRRGLRLLAGFAAVMAIAGAFMLGRTSAPDKVSPTTAATTIPRTTTTVDDRSEFEKALDNALRPFVGDWYWHGEYVHIDDGGSGTVVWRTYTSCEDGAPAPCDRSAGNLIIDGGSATFVLVRVSGIAAEGYVLASNDTKLMPLGHLRLELRPKDHLLFPGLGNGPLCGPNAPSDCGA